jgi:protein tyrosine phosphatase
LKIHFKDKQECSKVVVPPKIQKKTNTPKSYQVRVPYLQNFLLDEKTRVKLSTNEKHQEDYINANIIDLEGVKQKYIATQAPFSETFVDFWRMILEFRIKIIIMLTETEEDSPDEAFLGKVSFSFFF